MTSDRGNNRAPSDRLIDELLDGGVSAERSQDLLRAIRHDAKACEDLARARIGIELLREPVAAPDLSGQILGAVHARRRFLPGRTRRLVTAGRVAVAAGVVVAVGLASFVQRHVPEVRLADGPAPVSRIVEATGQSGAGPRLASQAVETLEASLVSPGRALRLSPRHRPEAGVYFDLSLSRTADGVAHASGVVAGPHAVGVPIAVGVPARLDPPGAEGASPFIRRFGSLLVVLREPRPPLNDVSVGESADSPSAGAPGGD